MANIRHRSSSLSLTALLYANQLDSNLFLLLSGVQSMSTRVLVQSALQHYNDNNNNTDASWVRASSDLQSALAGGGASAMLLQASLRPKNGTGSGGPAPLVNVTGAQVLDTIPLPYLNSKDAPSYLGDNDTGYPTNLYPNLTYTSTIVNSTFNLSNAFFGGIQLSSSKPLFIGPWLLNETFGLASITTPIINNTSANDILGWLTVVFNAQSILSVGSSVDGLGNTGQILIIAPDTPDQRVPASVQSGSDEQAERNAAKQQNVTFVIPPALNSSQSTRHPAHAYGRPNTPFEMQQYPAVLEAYTSPTAGSFISTNDEENQQVSAGYALLKSTLVNWSLIVEQSHGEVTAPINHLRNVLVACVFGTVGGILLLLLPIAHFSVRPIRRLREATKKSVEPIGVPSDDGSAQSFVTEDNPALDSGEEEDAMALNARKEGFMGRVTQWRTRRQNSNRERRERERHQTFRIPGKVQDRKHFIQDELTDLTRTFNEMSEELTMQYARLDERVKERTQELEVSKKAAEVANETKTLFIANISHELKTPLNGILGMCAVCMQEDDPTKIKRSLGIIYKSGDLLLHLLTDLLTFTKNQIGQQLTLDEREFRLADVSSQVLSIFEKQAKDGKIHLRVDYQGPQDVTESTVGAPLHPGFGPPGTGRIKDMFLWGDQHRILQVIINLVSNSLKFTPPNGSVDVRIRCLGDAPEKAESRKGSFQSKQSKRQSSKGSRRWGRASRTSVSPLPGSRDKGKYSDTALHINRIEPKSYPPSPFIERTLTPPPLNARTLLFEFEVEDTGFGIPESQQQRVFEPFMQGDLGLSKKYGGTGLGLSICSQLATLMKGSISLNSEVDRGSKFVMRIPLTFTKERADSTASSRGNSRRNSANFEPNADDVVGSRRRSTSEHSEKSRRSVSPGMNGFDGSTKPRLVGFSQPFFAASSPLDEPEKRLAAMERVAAQAARSGGKIRVLVAEDNKVNQEVVIRMLKLEDIYGKLCPSPLALTNSENPQMSRWPKMAKRPLNW